VSHRAITALAASLQIRVDLGKIRLETLCLLILSMVSARTVTRGERVRTAGAGADRLDPSAAAALLPAWSAAARLGRADLIGRGCGWTLALDRTPWAIGARQVNFLARAVNQSVRRSKI
jgi:hypothetical protein